MSAVALALQPCFEAMEAVFFEERQRPPWYPTARRVQHLAQRLAEAALPRAARGWQVAAVAQLVEAVAGKVLKDRCMEHLKHIRQVAEVGVAALVRVDC